MAVASAAGHPAYSGTFIPEIWSTNLNVKFYDAVVVAQIANTKWEGEIKDVGDKVEIRQVPDIQIRNYNKGGTLIIQRPEEPNIELLIDKAKYFNFLLDDIDKHQSDIALMDEWSQDSSEQMKIVVDQDVLENVPASVTSENSGLTAGVKSGDINLGTTGTPITFTKVNALEKIVDLGVVLDEQNVPETGRWLVIPPAYAGLIKKSDLKDASLTGDPKSPIRNGLIGQIDRFTVYSSNNLLTASDGGTATHILAGHPSGLTFASQITNMEDLRAESTFGTLVRGLNVYGYLVNKPAAVADLYCIKG